MGNAASCAVPSALNEHPTVEIYYPFWKRNIQVDKEIVPLLKTIWKLGIRTENSCQNHDETDRIWVCFSSPTDLTKFFNLLIYYGILGLAKKIFGSGTWFYRDVVDERDNMHLGNVLFPMSDLDLVMDALSDALADAKRQKQKRRRTIKAHNLA